MKCRTGRAAHRLTGQSRPNRIIQHTFTRSGAFQ
jgi:hypothetical protein